MIAHMYIFDSAHNAYTLLFNQFHVVLVLLLLCKTASAVSMDSICAHSFPYIFHLILFFCHTKTKNKRKRMSKKRENHRKHEEKKLIQVTFL